MTKGLALRDKSFCGFMSPLSLGNYFRPIRFLIGRLVQGKNPVYAFTRLLIIILVFER